MQGTTVFGTPCVRDSRVIAHHQVGNVARDRFRADEHVSAACSRAAIEPGSPQDAL